MCAATKASDLSANLIVRAANRASLNTQVPTTLAKEDFPLAVSRLDFLEEMARSPLILAELNTAL